MFLGCFIHLENNLVYSPWEIVFARPQWNLGIECPTASQQRDASREIRRSIAYVFEDLWDLMVLYHQISSVATIINNWLNEHSFLQYSCTEYILQALRIMTTNPNWQYFWSREWKPLFDREFVYAFGNMPYNGCSWFWKQVNILFFCWV